LDKLSLFITLHFPQKKEKKRKNTKNKKIKNKKNKTKNHHFLQSADFGDSA